MPNAIDTHHAASHKVPPSLDMRPTLLYARVACASEENPYMGKILRRGPPPCQLISNSTNRAWTQCLFHLFRAVKLAGCGVRSCLRSVGSPDMAKGVSATFLHVLHLSCGHSVLSKCSTGAARDGLQCQNAAQLAVFSTRMAWWLYGLPCTLPGAWCLCYITNMLATLAATVSL